MNLQPARSAAAFPICGGLLIRLAVATVKTLSYQ
jgi:hypothetical protein